MINCLEQCFPSYVLNTVKLRLENDETSFEKIINFVKLIDLKTDSSTKQKCKELSLSKFLDNSVRIIYELIKSRYSYLTSFSNNVLHFY